MPRARLISQLNVNERVVAEAVGGGKEGVGAWNEFYNVQLREEKGREGLKIVERSAHRGRSIN